MRSAILSVTATHLWFERSFGQLNVKGYFSMTTYRTLICSVLLCAVSVCASAQGSDQDCLATYHAEQKAETATFKLAVQKCRWGKTKCYQQERDDHRRRERQIDENYKQCKADKLQAMTPKSDKSREPFKLGDTKGVASAGVEKYNPEYGAKLPAMFGSTDFNGAKLKVWTAAGRLVGQGFAGPVRLESDPQMYSRAAGYLESSTQFRITSLWDIQGRAVALPPGGLSVGVGRQQ